MIEFRIKYFFLVIIISLISFKPNANEIELGGFLLDNTVSRQGHEFAQQLSQYWRELPNASGKNLLVKEVIVPQAGTRLRVYFDGDLVYQTYMGRRQTPIKDRVQQAMLLVLDAVANAQFKQKSPDLAEDEW